MNNDIPDLPDDDTEGHRFVPPEERLAVGDTPKPETAKDGDDDPDGASFDDSTEPEHDADTTESSDTPADDEDPDDTEGHPFRK